jgi:8-oxo-dGTP pyrophosphatase MutT (NUDIX family)
MNLEHCINSIRKSLNNPLPGRTTQEQMAPPDRIRRLMMAPDKGNIQPAAVLILLFPLNERLYTVFIRRNEYPGPHSGQISFPGGKEEPGDNDAVATALRESAEEIGIQPEEITILGCLTPLYIPVSNFNVTPVVGYTAKEPEFAIDPQEVQYLIFVPLEELLRSENIDSEERSFLGETFQIPYFYHEGEKIWGATAMILSEFIEVAGKC